MSRNQNSHFSLAPHANIQRSRFDMSHSVKLTCDSSYIVPFTWREVLPGDTFEVDTAILARMQTLTVPLMDDIYVDLYYFYCPDRLLWKHFPNMMGESDEPWYDDTAYSTPQLKFLAFNDENYTGKAQVKPNTLADYLGLPLATSTGTYSSEDQLTEVSHLPFRMYCKVYNDWFRNENLQDFTAFNMEDTNVTMKNDDEPWYGGTLLKANQFKNLWTSCLPEPQKGASVTIGVGDVAPIFTTSYTHDSSTLKHGADNAAQLRWVQTDGSSIIGSTGNNRNYNMNAHVGASTSTSMGTYAETTSHSVNTDAAVPIVPANLWADISSATGISINELRIAFATQRFYEQQARTGSRYIETLESFFGVSNGDARLQRSEYLGGNRVKIAISQVTQQSETETTPLATVGAYSLTTDVTSSFTKSFTEHGIVMGMLVIRYDHSYCQGIPPEFLRKDKFTYYWPGLANIGEQPILNKTLFLSGNKTKDDEVFGYQEAWAEYRYANNYLLGEMRTNHPQTLDYWHLGDYYESRPSLSEEWIVENPANIDRALAVSSNVANQFLVDIHIKNIATRPMPLFSVPGLDVM